MKRIEDKSNRQVTFSKRRTGLMKKARELSVLCDVDVAVHIFSGRGRLYEFTSGERYMLTDLCEAQIKQTASFIDMHKMLGRVLQLGVESAFAHPIIYFVQILIISCFCLSVCLSVLIVLSCNTPFLIILFIFITFPNLYLF